MEEPIGLVENPQELLKENYVLTQRNRDLELENYQLREEILKLEAKLAKAFNELMALRGMSEVEAGRYSLPVEEPEVEKAL